MSRFHCTSFRQPPPSAVPPVRLPTTEVLLETVLDGVELGVLDGELHLPQLVAVRRPGRGREPELLVRTLAVGTHPADGLAAFTAPDSWVAVGCLAGATTRSLDQPGATTGHTTFAFLLHRDGTSILSLSGEPRAVSHEDTDAPEGLVPDTCRRVLARPTPPPPQPVEHWLRALWLDRVFALVVGEPVTDWTWERIIAREPVGGFADIAALGWDGVREGFIRQGAAPFGVDAELAGWMDEGMFARTLLEQLADPALLLDELEPLLGPVHAQIVQQVQG